MKKSDLCHRIKKFAPALCHNKGNVLNTFLEISDFITCVEYQKVKIPNITHTDIELAHAATDIVYGKRYGKHATPEPDVLNFFEIFKEHVKTHEKKLVVEFTHKELIFGLIRTVLGHEEFTKIFHPHIITPFLTTIRFTVREEVVVMFMNDKQLHLKNCFVAGQNTCKLQNFVRMINTLKF
jgi:hypothetical protein